MNYAESEDEEVDLPVNLDSPTDSIDEEDDDDDDENSPPPFRSSVLTDRTVSKETSKFSASIKTQNPDDVHERARTTRAESTTPLKSPPKSSFPSTIPTEPTTEPQVSSTRVSFKDIQMIKPEPECASMAVSTSDPNPFDRGHQPRDISFTEKVAAYQKSLDDQYNEFETNLKDRDRSQELAALDWEDLEDRYQREIAPKLADEEKIMEDFELRFNVIQYRPSLYQLLMIHSNSCSGPRYRARESGNELPKGTSLSAARNSFES
jgi:hypothetical protein